MKLLLTLICVIMLATHSNAEPLRIALSKGSGSENYLKYGEWLKLVEPNIEIVDLINYTPQEAVKILQSCHGLFLTGGSDVHPGRYGKESDTSRCVINPKRDTLEFALIEKALYMKMPILGVCRGMQILNVALGGSLIVDIPEDYSKEINHSCPDKFAKCHIVDIIPNTHLHKITGVLRDSVTSAHHQGIEYLATGLIASAIAEDRTVEAFEWLDGTNKSYILGILWHPERMTDSKLSLPIARDFLLQAKKFISK